MRPNYVAKKSAWLAVTPLRLILFFLIVPLVMIAIDIVRLKCQEIRFYDKKVVSKKGIFNITETTSQFYGVLSVSVYQSFWGRIFNYGDVHIDVVGKWDISTTGIKDPFALKKYLEINHSTENTQTYIADA